MPSTLFDDLREVPAAAPEAPVGVPRLDTPERRALKLRPLALDALLPSDHQARVVWRYVESLDLSALVDAVRSVEGRAGRPAIDPRLLLALWLFATLDGVGSARQVERLCREHLAYLWLCGDVEVGRTVLAAFRVGHEAFLDELLTKSVASLRVKGLVTLERVAQDGLRVRASAGAGSFRREARLQAALDEARAQVSALKSEVDIDPGTSDRRKEAARTRAAEEREARLAAALQQMPEVEAAWVRNQRKRGQGRGGKGGASGAAPAGRTTGTTPTPAPTKASAPRASSTDPDARVMKMGDGGYRPALNCQLVTDVHSRVVVAVDVDNVGSDAGLHEGLVADVEERYGTVPAEWLVDAGFPTLATVQSMPDGCALIAPVMAPRDPRRDPHAPLPGDPPAVAAWRERMGTAAAKATYRLRAASAELVNAHVRNRGLYQFPVRGRRRANCVLLLHAIAHNVVRAHAIERNVATA